MIPSKSSKDKDEGDFPKVSNYLKKSGSAIDSALEKKESVFNVETGNIVPNSRQPRHDFDAEALRELANSIKEHGILQPLIATKNEPGISSDGPVKYQLIAGQRRWEAAKMIGLPHVPVIIRDSSIQQRLELALVENLQRDDLNPLESAVAFKQLQDEFGLSQQEIAKKVGKSREAVSNTVRLLNLPEEIKQALRKNQISEGHARVLVGIRNQRQQKNLFEQVLTGRLTVREVEEKARQIQPVKNRQGRRLNLHPFLRTIQEQIGGFFGIRASLSGSKKEGKIILSYKSEDELKKILDKVK